MTDRADPDAAAIRAAASVIVEAVLRLLDNDPHNWSARPCQTCKAVTSLVGRPFGCTRITEEKERPT